MKRQYETIVITLYRLESADIITTSGEEYGIAGLPVITSNPFRGEDDVLETTP